MNWTRFFISFLLAIVLIIFLNHKWGQLPPLGKLLSPQEGCWQNADAVNKDYNANIRVPGLQDRVEVWLDKRLVPHIFAQNEHDLYYTQGFITAKFRLWQMDIQTRAAAGKVAEVLGPAAVKYDRTQRRKGMLVAAERALQVIMANDTTKKVITAYTAGINAYIASLDYKDLPLEYKLLDYKPEKWTPLDVALLLKLMSNDLTYSGDDIEYTNALQHHFSFAQLRQLFPDRPEKVDPIIPSGTSFKPPVISQPVAPLDSILSAAVGANISEQKPDKDNGSNNWAIAPAKTKAGKAILCNDPHLGLNLPSLWFELQLQTPHMNSYGVSLPGAPGIVIGFTDSIAWGVTNAQRDVRDFYRVKFQDKSKKAYWFNDTYHPTDLHIDTIKVRGAADVYDTVAWTKFGPVIYDHDFPQSTYDSSNLLLHWSALDPGNELLTFYKLNHGRNYDDYVGALQTFNCPGQNFAFASVAGNIAIRQQGAFPVKWKDQGKFIMPLDSDYMWKGYIPFDENPQTLNPPSHYVFSANQPPTDSTYRYYYNGSFINYRADRIGRQLSAMNNITIQDMMKLQTDTYDPFSAAAVPLLLHYINNSDLKQSDQQYLNLLKNWDDRYTADAKAPAVFTEWWQALYAAIWNDDLQTKDSMPMPYPDNQTTIEWLERDSSMPYIDNKNTKVTETLAMLVTSSFHRAMQHINQLDSAGKLQWSKYRNVAITHLTKLPAFSREHLNAGGTATAISAIKTDHGPSWRMIVQMGSPVVAYGIYPGGQSGNPGSPYYDDMINKWVNNQYDRLYFYSHSDRADTNIHYKIILQAEKK